MSESLASEQLNFAHIYNEHLSAEPLCWIGSYALRCSASRTRFSRSFRNFRGCCRPILSIFFTSLASNIWSDDAVQPLLYTSWFGTRKNSQWASTKGRSDVRITWHRGHLRFSQQIRCGASVMCCPQVTLEDTFTPPVGIVLSEIVVESNSDASCHPIHR